MTAICGDPQANVDFYAGLLGLRLVKLTVNFDDPGAYHLYYGDGTGRPGSIVTFFPYPDGRRGTAGSGMVVETSLAAPASALGFWRDRLAAADVPFEEEEGKIRFDDPDGLHLAIVAGDVATGPGFPGQLVPAEMALGPMDRVTLCETSGEATARLMTDHLGFREVGQTGEVHHFEAGPGGSGHRVDVVCGPEAPWGRGGHGTVHHIAYRIDDTETQRELRAALLQTGAMVSPVMDRTYFTSIYFREPGGVLFEVATDGPGFLIDEPFETLGTELRLPPQYEGKRRVIESVLPELRRPGGGA